ncbi:hypothetical protein SAMN06265182_1523 [Persephonella hydrogeniphila]|uniref:DUF505 domain-containing protein n=1 Tax=Persephonella hydrogeniphila TaxID=198703 RepID=A0A285NIW5_9AQUI|nr:DUF505 domain-containing protein [Persephonella hydrogeniphila]SNZ09430.1 hypothetical protein SAMN06265182_1523 [Persephonella hydrogeniphila]
MVIRKEHALALLNAKSEEEKGLSCQITIKSEEEPYKELELQNLLEQGNSPVEYTLTYWGRNLVYLLEEMIQKGLIHHPSEWDERFRWIGSEVIAMIEAAILSGGLTGEETFEALRKRGFAQEIHEEKKGWLKKINNYASSVYEIYRNSKPRIEISRELGHYIASMPTGPAETKMLPEHGRFPLILESMRLISFSVPNSDVYTLSGLGQAVQKVVQTMAPSLETVINEDYMYALLKVLDRGIEFLTPQETELLEELAFIDSEGNILPAGEHLLEVYRLWSERSYRPVKTFNLETIDEELLIGIEKVWEKNKTNPDVIPTAEEIVHYLMEKPLKEYKHLIGFYGRMINQAMGYQKKEELKKKWAELFTIEDLFKHFWEKGNQWYEKLYDTVKESLYSLEAFNLIISEVDEKSGKTVYKLTPYGKKVLKDIKEKGIREIKATGVKAVTITKTEFGAPNYNWYKDAVDEHLIGGGYPTKSGLLYEELAYSVKRLPHLTRFELMVLHKIPEYGMFLDELFGEFDETLKEEIQYAVNKLEARYILDVLPNNALRLTEAGKLIKKALSGVPEGIANPVNPVIVRILQAIKQVGNLYVKEKRIRILPKNWEEAIKLSGLDKEIFEKEIAVARLAGFIGKTSIHESGIEILKAVELLNK